MPKYFLFVYGTLKKGYGNNFLLAESRFIGKAVTVKPYQFFDLGRFPGMLDVPSDVCVQGEVYEIDDATLAACDRLEGHPNFYRRATIDVLCEDGQGLKPFTYFVGHDYVRDCKPITNGVWPQETPAKEKPTTREKKVLAK